VIGAVRTQASSRAVPLGQRHFPTNCIIADRIGEKSAIPKPLAKSNAKLKSREARSERNRRVGDKEKRRPFVAPIIDRQSLVLS
jgi:hypothetical protein